MIDSYTSSEEGYEHPLGHLDQFLSTLSSGDDRDIVWQYLLSASCNEYEQSTLYEPYRDKVRELARQYECSIDAIRNTLMIRLETDEFDDEDDEEEEQRKTAQWSLHPSTREPAESVESVSEEDEGLGIGDRKTVSFGPNMDAFKNQSTAPAPESSRQIDSKPAPVSRKMPKAIIAKSIPSVDIEPQAFIDNLTTEGRRMLEIVLKMQDMMDGVELSKLEKKYGKRGFVLLSSFVTARRNINRNDPERLKEILEKEPVVKRRSLPKTALFGRRKIIKPASQQSRPKSPQKSPR